MKAKRPHWQLDEAKRLAADNKLILSKTKAQAFFPDIDSAVAAVKTAIAELTERQFAHTLLQVDACDVYGVMREGKGW